MKPIIFARIADMKFYKGITDTDKPVNGGSYVKDTNYAHECYNFDPVILEDNKEYCLGFTQLLGGKDPQLHIERIVGCTRFFPVLFFNYKHRCCKSYSMYLLVYLRKSLFRVCIDGV